MTGHYAYTPYIWPVLASPALLRRRLPGGPPLPLVRVDATDRSAEALHQLEPDVVVFDLATARPDIEGRMGPKANREHP